LADVDYEPTLAQNGWLEQGVYRKAACASPRRQNADAPVDHNARSSGSISRG